MPAQDDARENQLVDLFNLEREDGRARHGTDAILRIGDRTLEFELKSVTTANGSLSTVRDLGRDHIEKWRNKHWIVAFYGRGGQLEACKYASPDAMSPWIEEKWRYIEPDFRLADIVPGTVSLDEMRMIIGDKPTYTKDDAKRLHKLQLTALQYTELMDVSAGYSPTRMLEIFRERVGYLLRRGSTLNNPHIPASYFGPFPSITRNHAATLRALVTNWLDTQTGA